jgi:tyrosinase
MGNGGASQPRIRRDVWKLPAGDDTLGWYGKAIARLQTRLIGDPTSWRYQAAIHDYNPATDPFRSPQDQLPPDSDRFWQKCQHSGAYFLPWHRMYLLYFEEIIAAAVVELGGPAGWSLPYWNYSDASNPDAQKLPPAFRASSANGAANPLYVAARAPGADDGAPLGDELDVDLQCLEDSVFFGEGNGAGGGFGGPNTRNPVHNGSQLGALEAVPHGSMHVAVGGSGRRAGWMSDFTTAALDPIFWLHHANIDRLWQVWLRRDPQHVNPTDSTWLGQSFEFHDSTGAIVSLTPRQVLDTTAPPLGYQYEDVTDPFATGA